MNRNHCYYHPYDQRIQQRTKKVFHLSQRAPYKTLNNNYLLPKQTNVPHIQCKDTTDEKYWKRRPKNHNRTKKAIKEPNESVNVLPPKWSIEDAVKALELEKSLQSTQFILRFPDPILDKSIIQGFSAGIVSVRVQQPITPRFVFIQLNPELDHEVLQQEISRIPFGTGRLKLEKCDVSRNEHKPEDIDPLTLFLGNIHPLFSVQSVKEKVPKAYRVDVGFAKKHKFGKYAFAKFRMAEDAREAFVRLSRMKVDGQEMDLVVRFRRVRGNISVNRTDDTNSKTEAPDKKSIQDRSKEAIHRISNHLFQKDTLNWEALRQIQTKRYESKKTLPRLTLDPTNLPPCKTACYDVKDDDLDDIFKQIDSNISYALDDDLDFC